MAKWKKWQRSLFLAYLLLLNIVVFSALTYALLNRQAKNLPQSDLEMLADLPVSLPKKSKPEIFKLPPNKPAASPTLTTLVPAPLTTNSPRHRSTASMNDSLTTSSALRESTKEPQPSPTQPPQPTKTFTVTPQPTATQTPTATYTSQPSLYSTRA